MLFYFFENFRQLLGFEEMRFLCMTIPWKAKSGLLVQCTRKYRFSVLGFSWKGLGQASPYLSNQSQGTIIVRRGQSTLPSSPLPLKSQGKHCVIFKNVPEARSERVLGVTPDSAQVSPVTSRDQDWGLYCTKGKHFTPYVHSLPPTPNVMLWVPKNWGEIWVNIFSYKLGPGKVFGRFQKETMPQSRSCG